MKHFFPFLVASLFSLVACSNIDIFGSADSLQPNTYDSIAFSNDHQFLNVYSNVFSADGYYQFTNDPSASIQVVEVYKVFGDTLPALSAPAFVKLTNLRSDDFKNIDMHVLILVDLTLSQSQIDAQRLAVERVRMSFCHTDLFISFIHSKGRVTPLQLVTDFVMENEFVADPDPDKYLFAAIYDKLLEISNPASPISESSNKALYVFSDGLVWGFEEPLDPQHFEIQEKILNFVRSDKSNIAVYYANFPDSNAAYVPSAPNSNNIINFICESSGGAYQEAFDWSVIADSIASRHGCSLFDYIYTLKCPDGKVFDGSNITLSILGVTSDSSYTFAKVNYCEGSVLNPFIVNGASNASVIFKGFCYTLLLLLLVFLVFQIVIPRISYLRFLKKYVRTYSGNDMSINGKMVANECYLCKAPFVEGDVIVGKCDHTMHKQCWDENDFRCPEYGSHCHDGSFYYNPSNIWDLRNAHYFLHWIFVSIVVAFISWMVFCLAYGSTNDDLLVNLLISSADAVHKDYVHYFYRIPSFAFVIAFTYTFLFCIGLVRRQIWWRRFSEILFRSFFAGVLGYIIFSIDCICCFIFNIQEAEALVGVVSWSLLSIAIVLALTFRTYLPLRKKVLFVSFLMSVLSVIFWSVFFVNAVFDYRLTVLICFIVYACGFAVSLADSFPTSDHYVLHLEGAIKATDVALYKYFRSNPLCNVTIGKSVDCTIQTSWDIKGEVNPIHAEIFMLHGALYVRALDGGVFIPNYGLFSHNVELKVGRPYRLYHNTVFTIGNTSFTYREFDVKY